MPYYALVLNCDRPKGQPPDPQFDCFKDHLYSLTSIKPDREKVPAWFDILELPRQPDFTFEVWDTESRAFVPRGVPAEERASIKPIKEKRVKA